MDYFQMLFIPVRHASVTIPTTAWHDCLGLGGRAPFGPAIVSLHEQLISWYIFQIILMFNIGDTLLRFNSKPDSLVILDHFLVTLALSYDVVDWNMHDFLRSCTLLSLTEIYHVRYQHVCLTFLIHLEVSLQSLLTCSHYELYTVHGIAVPHTKLLIY